MQARIKHPALIVPGSLEALQRLTESATNAGIPAATLYMLQLRASQINGGPGVLVFDGQERLIGVTALEIADGEIKGIASIGNPDKLRHLGPVGDLGSVLRSKS